MTLSNVTVDEINKVESDKRRGVTFEFQNDESVRQFKIRRYDSSTVCRDTYVVFTQLDAGLEIMGPNDEKFQVIAEWDEHKASCRLTDGVALEPWQPESPRLLLLRRLSSRTRNQPTPLIPPQPLAMRPHKAGSPSPSASVSPVLR